VFFILERKKEFVQFLFLGVFGLEMQYLREIKEKREREKG